MKGCGDACDLKISVYHQDGWEIWTMCAGIAHTACFLRRRLTCLIIRASLLSPFVIVARVAGVVSA